MQPEAPLGNYTTTSFNIFHKRSTLLNIRDAISLKNIKTVEQTIFKLAGEKITPQEALTLFSASFDKESDIEYFNVIFYLILEKHNLVVDKQETAGGFN